VRLAIGQSLEKMDFRRVPTTFRTDEGGSGCLNHTNTGVYAARLLSFWDLEVGYVLGRGAQVPGPQEKPWARSLE